MTEQLMPFDPAEHLDTPEHVAAFLEAATEEDDPAFLVRALHIAACAHARLHPDAPPLPPLADDPTLPAFLDRLHSLDLRLSFTPRRNANGAGPPPAPLPSHRPGQRADRE